MAAGKTKSINEIDDIGEMFEAMAVLDISSKGLQTLQDMKDRVKTTIDQFNFNSILLVTLYKILSL